MCLSNISTFHVNKDQWHVRRNLDTFCEKKTAIEETKGNIT